MILDNRRIMWFMPNNFYGCVRHETCGSEDCYKIAKLETKITSHGHRLKDIDDVQICSKRS